MSWFFLSIITAVSFALVNLFDKFFLVRYTKTEYGAVKMLGFFSLCIFLFVYIFTDIVNLSSSDVYIPVLSGIFEILYIYIYFCAINNDDVGFAVSLFAFTPIFTLLISYLLGDALTIIPVLGIFIITFGVILLYISREALKNIRHNKTFFSMIITTFISALSFLLLDKSLETFSIYQTLIVSRIGVFLGALAILPFIKTKHSSSKSWPFIISEVLYLGTLYICILALSKGKVAYVSGVVNTQPIFVFLGSWFLFRNAPSALKEKFVFRNKFLTIFSILVTALGAFLIRL